MSLHSFRKSASLVLSSLASILSLHAAGPQLTVTHQRGEAAPLVIDEIKGDIFIFEDLVETTLTLTFRNTQFRVLEGEFSMPLPAGATVSGYALDVNGKMRDGVIVEKERARNAYYEIKRQMIDPGFVEREAGNIYRTKIYPIPSNGTKTVRLSYCQILDSKGDQFQYRLPFAENVEVAKLDFQIHQLEGDSLKFPADDKLTFAKEKPGYWTSLSTNVRLGKELAFTIPHPSLPRAVSAGEYTYLRVPIDDRSDQANLFNIKTLDLGWDCSRSGHLRNHQAELDLLAQLCATLKNVTINLTFLHLDAVDGGTFEIKNGDFSKLRTVLKDTFYDGATHLANFQPNSGFALLFTDGIDQLDSLKAPWKSSVFLIDSLGSAQAYWRNQAHQYFDLKKHTPAQILPLIIRAKTQIFPSDSNHLTPLSNQKGPPRFFAKKEGPTLSYNNFAPGTFDNPISLPIQKIDHPRAIAILKKIRTQEKLQSLESAFLPNRQTIITHCKEHGLVSDETSFIVLDRFEDYVRYRIPPPEEPLRLRYLAEIKKKKAWLPDHHQLIRAWNARRNWHSRAFPWHEHILRPALSRISRWENALRKTFTPEEIPSTAGTIIAWKNEALKLTKEKLEIKTGAKLDTWADRIVAMNKDLGSHPSLQTKNPPKKTAVAVRGFVHSPGKIPDAAKLTFLKAVERAGGINAFGTPTRVALYRNAQKTLFNTVSDQFKDFPLQSGDMIVVQQIEPEYWGDGFHDDDPFSTEGGTDSVDPSTLPAVVEESSGFFTSDDDQDPFASAAGASPETIKIKPGTKIDTSILLPADAFAQELAQTKDPLATYRKYRPIHLCSDVFYIEASRLLKKHGHPAFARRVLSNLIEDRSADPAANRTWAYLHAKENDWDTASKILTRIATHFPDDQAIALDQAWIAGHLNLPEKKTQHLLRAAFGEPGKLPKFSYLAEFATAELNHHAKTSNQIQDLRHTLPVGLRVVVISPNGRNISLKVKEPTNTSTYAESYPSTGKCGGRAFSTNGIVEYQIKNAIPGPYQLSYRSKTSTVVRLQIYRNWSLPNETLEEKILILPSPPALAEFFITHAAAE